MSQLEHIFGRYRVHIANVRDEGDRLVGEGAIFTLQVNTSLYEWHAVLGDPAGVAAFITSLCEACRDYPDLLRHSGEIGTALLEWGLDPEAALAGCATLSGDPRPGDVDLEVNPVTGVSFSVRNVRPESNRFLRGTVQRFEDQQPKMSVDVLLGYDPDEFKKAHLLHVDITLMKELRERTFGSFFGDGPAKLSLDATGSDAFPRSRVPAFPRSGYMLPAEQDAAMPFPDALPEPIGRFVQAAAAALDVPPEFIGIPLLALTGGIMGNRWCIELKPGYRQWPILYTALVGHPGTGKTAGISAARQPIDQLQREAWSSYKEQLVAYRRAQADLNEAERPSPQQFFTTDTTMEALAPMLTANPGVTVVHDELVSWAKSMDAYRGGRGSDRQRWLSGWSKDPWKIDRKKADPLFIPDPVVCVVGGVQPDVLHELAHEAGAHDGFIARTLWSYPDEHYPEETDATLDEGLVTEIAGILRKLRPDPQLGGDFVSIPIILSGEARSLWKAWRRDNNRILRNESGLMRGIVAKLHDQAARIALILHTLTHPERPDEWEVAADTMAAAIDLAEYFRAHALRVLPAFGQVRAEGTGSIVARVATILDGAKGDWISRSSIRDELNRNPTSSEVSEALTRLEEQGRAERRVNREAGTGRPPEEWRSLVYAGTREREYEDDPGELPF